MCGGDDGVERRKTAWLRRRASDAAEALKRIWVSRSIRYSCLAVAALALYVVGRSDSPTRTALAVPAAVLLVACWWLLVGLCLMVHDLARPVRRSTRYFDALVDDAVLDEFSWRESARLVLRISLVTFAAGALAIALPAYSPDPWIHARSMLLVILVALPVVLAGLRAGIDALPRRRPPSWPAEEEEPTTRVFRLGGPGFGLAAFASSAVFVLAVVGDMTGLTESDQRLLVSVGFVLPMGVPVLMAVATFVRNVGRLVKAHFRHAGRQFGVQWAESELDVDGSSRSGEPG